MRKEQIAVAFGVVGFVLSLVNTFWPVYLYFTTRTFPRLIVSDIEDLEFGIYPESRDTTITFITKFHVTVYVITNNEFRLRITEPKFEWYNVTERLGPSYITPNQRVWLTSDRFGRTPEKIGLQSGPVDIPIPVECRFKTNQTAFHRYNVIPLGTFHFTLEYLDLKTNCSLRQVDMTRVWWVVRSGTG